MTSFSLSSCDSLGLEFRILFCYHFRSIKIFRTVFIQMGK